MSATPSKTRKMLAPEPWTEPRATAVLVLADATVVEGAGVGATGEASGEVCFNTAMTGYEEILTDPSYAGQIVTFTFPHIGNVGVNDEDIETVNMASASGLRGVVLAEAATQRSNWRASRDFDEWLLARGIIGICGVDTRALTAMIREKGMPNAMIAHHREGVFNIAALRDKAAGLPLMAGLDLVLIESGGDNLAATFSPELADLTIYVIDVAAGDKIPSKGGPGITRSDLLVINKIDLAPYVGASLDVMKRDARRMRATRPFVMTNLRNGHGIADIARFVETKGGLAT